MTRISSVTTHLIVAGAAAASAWYQQAFDAVEHGRIELVDGRLIHLELTIGTAGFMLADEFPEHDALGPRHLPTHVCYLQTDDVDALWQQAVDAGATVTRPLAEAIWGEREGQLLDPFGYRWGLTQTVRTIPADELATIVRAAFAGA